MGFNRDFIKGGHNSEDWLEAFEKNRDVIAPPDETKVYDPESLAAVGFGSVRSDAPKLQTAPLDEGLLWGIPGHLAPDNVIILIDTMNSGIPP